MTDGAKLIGLSGDYKDQEFPLKTGENLVGRGEDSDPQFIDPRVSRTHARIVVYRGSARIEDLGSTDGTYLNGDRVTASELKNGDKLRFGGSVFLVHLPAPAPRRQDNIATVLSSEDPDHTHIGVGPPAVSGAARTRLARSARRPPPAQLATAHGALPPVPPPPPVVPPPPPPISSRKGFNWKIISLGLAALMVIGMTISLGVLLLRGGEEAASEITPEAAPASEEPAAITTRLPAVAATLTATAEPTSGLAQPVSTSELPAPAVTATVLVQSFSQEQIAFASNRSGLPQIYLINLDGGEPIQLTDVVDGACQPAWSPDGITLAFTSPCTANREAYAGSSIFVMQVGLDGATTTPMPFILSLFGGDYDPAWSPDGTRIAFTSQRTGRPQIFVAGADGSGPVNLNDDLAFNWSPAWSPDGGELAFITGRAGQAEVWLISSSGGDERRFTRGDGKSIARPSWSPDGGIIAFEKVVGNLSRLIGAPLIDGGVRELQVCQAGSLSLQPMGEPAWSPDGTKLAFETWPGGVEHDIAMMNQGCTGYVEVTSDAALDFDPAWRPVR